MQSDSYACLKLKMLPLGYTHVGERNGVPLGSVPAIWHMPFGGRTLMGILHRRKNMLVGYIRISTVGQNTARQEVLMQELGVEKIFIDRLSGKNTDRPQLKEMIGTTAFPMP